MANRKYSEEQIVKIVKEIDGGASLASVSRAHGVKVETLYRWRDKYAGMGGTELAVFRALQAKGRPVDADEFGTGRMSRWCGR